MGKCGCKTTKCSGKCGGSSEAKTLAQMSNKLLEMEALLAQVAADTKFLQCGHPIIMIDNVADIACFSEDDGLGSDCWQGWALCDGTVQKDKDNKDFETPNLLDKFVVGGGPGSSYNPGDTGGANSVALSVAEMPVHTHTVNDPGHNHGVTDPGHTHAHTQDPHTHAGEVASHNHGVDITSQQDGDHNHTTGFTIIGDANGGSNFNALNDSGGAGASVSTDPGHTHAVTGSTDNASPGLTIEEASIDIENEEAFTGITVNEDVTGITNENAGEGVAHENRPPFYAVVFVIKL
jgi:microcystin-dependent protein